MSKCTLILMGSMYLLFAIYFWLIDGLTLNALAAFFGSIMTYCGAIFFRAPINKVLNSLGMCLASYGLVGGSILVLSVFSWNLGEYALSERIYTGVRLISLSALHSTSMSEQVSRWGHKDVVILALREVYGADSVEVKNYLSKWTKKRS